MDVVSSEEVSMNFMELMEKMLIEKYGKTLVDHVNNPRNHWKMKDANGYMSFTGPCNDTMQIWVKIIDDVVEKISFQSSGCEMTLAVGSMLTQLAKGKKTAEALQIKPQQIIDELGGLPEDHYHCATLARNSLYKAVLNYKKSIATEREIK